jgi:hypothetical protein
MSEVQNDTKTVEVLQTENVANKQVAIYEEIRKDLATSTDVKVPLNYVFGRGQLANLQSFGNTSIQENAEKVDKALQNMSELQNIWNHSHTQWIWRHLNLSYHSPHKNMRQICAEIAAKRAALNDAKWKQVETEMRLRQIEEELAKENLDYWDEVRLKIEMIRIKEGLSEGISYIEGAMKDVLVLNELYEQLKEKVSDFSEYDIEKVETKSHLKRALVQCIRDVRQFGSISKGEQEYIEQIGINPMKLQNLMRKYVQAEENSESWDVSGLYQFVDQLTEELVDVYKVDVVRMKMQGFNENPIENFSYTEKVALLNRDK